MTSSSQSRTNVFFFLREKKPEKAEKNLSGKFNTYTLFVIYKNGVFEAKAGVFLFLLI